MEVPSSSAAALEEDDYEPNFGGSLPPAPPGGRAAPAAGARARIPGPLGALLSGELSGAAAEAAGGVGVQQSQPARPAAFSPSKHYFRRAASWVRMEAELGEAGMEARSPLKRVLEQCARCERIERVPVLVVLLESVGASEAGDDVRAMVSDETAQMEATISVDVLRDQAGKIVGGATMHLKDVAVLTLAPWAHHLIIHGDCVKSVEAPAAKQSEHAAAPAAASVSAAATAHREPPPPQPRPPPHVPPPPQPGVPPPQPPVPPPQPPVPSPQPFASQTVASEDAHASELLRQRPPQAQHSQRPPLPLPLAAPPLAAAAAAAGGKRPRDEEPPAPPAAAPPPPPANFMLPPPPPPAMPAGRVGSARINRAVAAAPPPARVASRVTAPTAAAPAPTPEPAAAVLDPSRISQSTADDLDDDEW